MARGKLKIKKIDNPTARKVTFCKRKNGVLKKANELAVLCDAQVAIIIFSPTGKLYHFSSSSMEEILERYDRYCSSTSLDNYPFKISIGRKLVGNDKIPILSKEAAEISRQLSRLRGEDLQGLTINELQLLENSLCNRLNKVMEKKTEKIMEEIDRFREKAQPLPTCISTTIEAMDSERVAITSSKHEPPAFSVFL